jgi:hypothetical protein
VLSAFLDPEPPIAASPVASRDEALHLVVKAMGKDHVAYFPKLATRFGTTSAILLAQILYWTQKQREAGRTGRDGWIYKSMVELQKETGMGRREIESARRRLLEEKVLRAHVAGMPRVTYYRIDLERLSVALTGRAPPSGASWERSDFMTALLGKPILLNRLLARMLGGVNGALYLSFLIFVTRRQLSEDARDRAWIVDQSLESISDSLKLTQRQSSYARSTIRRMGLIEEWRTGSLPARSKTRVCWANLAEALLRHHAGPVDKLSTGKLEMAAKSTEFERRNTGKTAPKPAPIVRPQESCDLDCRIPANWTRQNVPTGPNKTYQLDLALRTPQTEQNVPTEAAFLLSPIKSSDYTNITISPPPLPITGSPSETRKSVEVEVIFPRLIPEHLRASLRSVLKPLAAKTSRYGAQDVVDELVARLRRPQLGEINNVVGYVRKLVAKALDGTLELELASQEKARRVLLLAPPVAPIPKPEIPPESAESREARERCMAMAKQVQRQGRAA